MDTGQMWLGVVCRYPSSGTHRVPQTGGELVHSTSEYVGSGIMLCSQSICSGGSMLRLEYQNPRTGFRNWKWE